MMAVIIKRIIGRVTAFARAETGQSAVIVALLMTVICGFAALAIDLRLLSKERFADGG